MNSCKRNVIQSIAKDLGSIKWVLCIFMFALASCEHRELMDPNTGHYLRIYLDEEIKNVTCGFYDGRTVSERYFQRNGEDERGFYIDGYIGAEPGTYNLLVYNFGSSVTHIRNEQDYYNMQAYTDPVSEVYLQYLPVSRQEINNEDIMNEPEHLFHAVGEPIVIPRSLKVDTLKNASGDWFEAHSVVKSYYLQLRIKGIEWVTSAVSLLSGMAKSTVLHKHNGMVAETPINIFFGMNYTGKQTVRDGTGSTAILYATFSTFGKVPGVDSELVLNFEFMRKDGTSQVEKIDITDEFYTPLAIENQWILLEHEIQITPPEGSISGGGLTPGVDPWEDVQSDVQL